MADSGAAGRWRGIAVRLGQHELAIPLSAVGEVRPLPALARVPGVRPWLLGVGNANGRLLTVTDLGLYAGVGACASDSARVVVVEHEGHLTGLVVDEVSGVETFDAAAEGDVACEAPAALAPCAADVVAGREGARRVLDVGALLGRPDFLAAGTVD